MSTSASTPLSCAAITDALPSLSSAELESLIVQAQQLIRSRARTQTSPPVASHAVGASFSSLAKIEQQLVMRMCDRRTLLSVARCSRATLVAASDDFAWQHLSPVRLCSSVPDLARKLSTSLLRFVDVSLWWTYEHHPSLFAQPPHHHVAAPVSTPELDAMLAVTRLRGLDCCDRADANNTHMEYLLISPACAQLTELRVSELHPRIASLLPTRQPLLQTFDFGIEQDVFNDGTFASVAQLSNLTDLHVQACAQMDCSALSQCCNLRALSLHTYSPSWPTLLAVVSMRTLRSLTLRFGFPYIGWEEEALQAFAASWSVAFANLCALESLRLGECWRTNDLLKLVGVHCRSLHTLHVDVKVLDPHASKRPDEYAEASVETLRAVVGEIATLKSLVLDIGQEPLGQRQQYSSRNGPDYSMHELREGMLPVDQGRSYDLRIQHARVLPDPQKILSWEWVRHQLYTINWSNVALLLTVLILSRSIANTLDSQKIENSKAAEQLSKLDERLVEVRTAVDVLQRGSALIDKFGNLTSVLERLDQMDANVTRLSAATPSSIRAQYTPTLAVTQLTPLTALEQSGTALQVSSAGWSLMIREAGTYLIGCQTDQMSGQSGQDAFIAANSTAFDLRSENSYSTLCSDDAGTSGRVTRIAYLGLNIANSMVMATSVGISSFQQEHLPVYVQLCGVQPLRDAGTGRRHELWAFKLA